MLQYNCLIMGGVSRLKRKEVDWMRQTMQTRFFAALLALVMVISMLPMSVFAAETTGNFVQVTDLADITAGGQFVLVANVGGTYKALSTTIGNKIDAVDVTVSDGTVTAKDLPVWTAASMDGGVSLSANGNYLGYGTKTNFAQSADAYAWVAAASGEGFRFTASTADTRSVGYQESGARFGAYSTTNTSGYVFDLLVYKLEEGSGETPSDPTEPSTAPTEPSAPAVQTMDIAAALAGAADTEFTVKGVVTLVDGQNLYLQDATGGICLRRSIAPTDVALGDTVIGTGKRADYNGLPQLGSGTYVKSEGLTLKAKETTIDALTNADICTYVKISGVEVTEVYDNNGAWATPNVTVKDAAGNTIQLYKAVVDGIAMGDTVDILAAVGVYKTTTLQLRNTLASEVTKVEGGSTPTDPTDPTTPSDPTEPSEPTGKTAELVTDVSELTEMTEIIIVAADADAALSTTQNGNNRGEAAITKDGNFITYGEDTQIITIENGSVEDTYALFVGEGYLYAASSEKNYLRTEGEKSDNSAWTITIDEAGIATIKANGEFTRNWLRYNSSSKIFSCYGSGQKDVKIYKVVKEDENPLSNGSKVVIYNPANMMALSTTYNGYYNNGTAVTLNNGVLSGYTDADVWTVGVNDDGTYTFSTSDGKKLSMGASFSSTPLDDVNTAWEVSEAATADCVYIKNVVRGNYLEWYSSKSNWSSYYKISDEALFAQTIYKVPEGGSGDEPSQGSVLTEGEQVVIYNLDAKGVLALQDDNTESPSITGAAATIADGKATAENGALIFTVERNGEYYRFFNETYGYLCSNGTGNNAFYQANASDDADWTLAVQGTGYTMESRTAKFNGKYSQYMEYYAGAYKTYSMYNVTDYDIYTFQFYPCANTSVSAGVVNQPTVSFGMTEPNMGLDWNATFTVDAVFGVKELYVVLDNTQLTAELSDGVYTVTVPAELITGGELVLRVTGTDNQDVFFSCEQAYKVIDKPVIDNVTPAANAETGSDKRPVISADIVNAGEDAAVTMMVNGEQVVAVFENGKITYTPEADMADGIVSVEITVTRADGETASRTWRFTVGEATYQLLFGQLHSHTTYSDGSGTLESALDYVKNLPESANVDFVAFTDHSNYFDKSGAANPEDALYDMSKATDYSQQTWAAYKSTIADFNNSQSDVIAIGGYEMTWSGGPGHINTFSTPGIVSRNNATLNNKTNDAGMKAYYALLSRPEGIESISQFNHPGSTFGTFSDFAYWDAVIDTRIQLVEVGNGEGQVGAGGYYPSYEYYTMALDKGWHVAPTNNQDNHKGKWGNANDARDVILTSDVSEEGLYDAIRAMRVYSTEDKNLEIYYTVNGLQLGSSIVEVPEELNFKVTVSDPDASDSISKVELIVNSGKVAYTWDNPSELAAGELAVTLAPNYSYYYVRVTEGDGDLAVTAPVWVGESLKLGISSVECGTSTPVTGEELTLTTTLFNSESKAATVKSLTYTVNGSEVIGTDMTGYTLNASGNLAIDFKYTPTVAKISKIAVTAVVVLDDEEYTFTMDITLDIMDADKLVYVGIDASHFNEYVAGNYKDSMGNFSALASEYGVRTVELKTSEELIAACSNAKFKGIILTAPSRRNGSALRDPYATYSDDEIAALKAFNAAGGALVLTGWGDYYESYAAFPAEDHMAAQQNKLLEALGSSIRIADDETKDDTHNGGQSQRLYLSVYDFENFLLDGVEYDANNPYDNMYTELYSQYGGASIYVVDGQGNPTASVPATVTPAVYAFDTTYSADDDKDNFGGLGQTQKYAVGETQNLMVLASEQLEGQGLIVVAGAAFLSNFEVQATIEDSGAEKNYSNYKICENLLKHINPVVVTDIAEVQAQADEGVKYTIEGVVTSNASGYDKATAFFDCIYLQDETAGINAFPVAGNFKIGDKVRVTGTTSSYNGERQIAVTDIELISEGNEVQPTEITAAQLNDGSKLGSLITLKGNIQSFDYANGLVQTIMVKDAQGDVARVFIDGYITTTMDVENLEVGNEITVTGLASYDNSFNAPEGPFPRIRIRNRADVVVVAGSAKLEDVVMIGTNPHVTGNIVSWNAVEYAKFYQVYRLRVGQTTWELLTNTGSLAYKDTTAEIGVKYYYKVRARNNSQISSMNIASVSAIRPIANVVMAGTTPHRTGNIVSWNAVEGAKLYQVYRLRSGETAWELLKNTGSLAYKDETAEVGVKYYYKVRARAGLAISSMNIASVGAVRPSGVTKLDAVGMKSAMGHTTGNIIYWNAVENAQLYQVYRRAADSNTWELLTNTGSLGYKDTTAEVGVKYYYKVVARNGDVKSTLDIAAVSAIRPA